MSQEIQTNDNIFNKNAFVHPTAILEEGATISDGVYVGPYCVIGKDVVLKDSVRLVSHVCVAGLTTVGEGTIIYPFASIGHPPQDLKFKGEPSTVVIGKNNTIREYVTIQPGTEGGEMTTVVGDGCLLMVGVHVAHDCKVGNNIVLANYATLAGHVQVDDNVVIGGLSAFQQRVRVGTSSMIGGMSGVEKDVIPYALVMGDRAHLHGLNLIGLRRRGISNAHIQQIQSAYRTIFEEHHDKSLAERVQLAKAQLDKDNPLSQQFIDFIEHDSRRHFCLPKTKH